ncbi:MAG: hypothetical protein PHW24_01435 [Candidatus Moranbacteria bacterium]|nr:hypothetical protein [Candidatus Moranbacteria bacterium]
MPETRNVDVVKRTPQFNNIIGVLMMLVDQISRNPKASVESFSVQLQEFLKLLIEILRADCNKDYDDDGKNTGINVLALRCSLLNIADVGKERILQAINEWPEIDEEFRKKIKEFIIDATKETSPL